MPSKVYSSNGWKNYGDWLGTGTIAARLREYRSYDEARTFVHKLHLKNVYEWREYCESGEKPEDIPAVPHNSYLHKGWKNYGDWLGTGTISNIKKKFLPYSEAKEFVQKLKLISVGDWNEYCRSGKKPNNIPSNPDKTYSGQGWHGIGDWLGTGTIAARLREYRSFEEARTFVHKLKLKNRDEWTKYCQSGNKPFDIPSYPEQTYKEKGWLGVGDWLGTGTIAARLKEYRSFEEAQAFVHKLKLKSQHDWKEYCKSRKKPNDIPNAPNQVYNGMGWKGWGDWLGTGIIAPRLRKYRKLNEAREFARGLNLMRREDWRVYCKLGKKPDDIPSFPEIVYSDEGWINYGDWLGTGIVSTHQRTFSSFKEARTFVHKLKLKSQGDWYRYCKSGKKPEYIPSNPQRSYLNDGWQNFGDWLGTGTVASRLIKYRLYKEARVFVHNLKLKTVKEWIEYCHSGMKPFDIPTYPNQTYLGKGWNGMRDWLGTRTIATSQKTFLQFKEAREFVQKLGLDNRAKWRGYCKSGKRISDIPSAPDKIYKDKGWNGWNDWFGTK
jgi:hypothetical protein